MRTGFSYRSLLFTIFFFSATTTEAKYDPRLNWQTLTTEHFYIHYHDGQENLAQKYAVLAEKKYPAMIKKLGHEPYFRTHLVVSDIYDDPNGMTSLEPWNRVELFAAKPLPDSPLGRYNDWDDLLFTHEYTHVLNLDQIRGLPAISRYVVGRYYFPNEWQPAWLIEGSAVFEESADGFGRLNSNVVDMYFRTAVEADSLKSINRSSNFIRDWPTGHVPYFYGGKFIEWLKKKYPDKNIHDIYAENADNVWPFLNNTNARDVFGAAFTDLWEEWQRDLTKEQKARIEEIKKNGVTELTRLTQADFYQTFPRFDATGKTLWYLNENNYSRPTLNRLRILGKKGPQKGVELNSPAFLALHGDQPYVLDAEVFRSFSLHKDIFNTSSGEQLTEKMRALSFDFTHKGEIVAITQSAGEQTLALYDTKGTLIRKYLGATTLQLSYARVSPDGRLIVFCALRIGDASTHLYLFDSTSGELQQLTDGRAVDLHPAFTAGGDKIVFSSDRTGVFNIYELTLSTGNLARLTNVTGGVFYPDVSRDGNSVAVAEFTDQGYRIALFDRAKPVLENQTLTFRKAAATELNVAHAPMAKKTAESYSIFPSILPSAWSPSVYFYSTEPYLSSVGGSIFGTDALQRDFYGIGYSRGIESGNNYFGSYFETQRFYPDFYIAPYLSAGPSCSSVCYAGGSAGMYLPYLKYYRRHAGYANTYFDYEPGYQYTDFAGDIGYSFSNTQYFSRSISPENGRSLGVSATYRRIGFGTSPYSYGGNFSNMQFSYSEYLPGIFRNNVILARAYVAQSINLGDGNYGFGDTSRYAVFFGGYRVRGYGSGNYGTGLTVVTLEYRFPIYQPDWGFFRVPVFFRDFYGKIFADAGQSYSSWPDIGRTKTSAGAEIGLSSIFGFRYWWSARVGYARGFNEGGEHQIYFAVLGYTGLLTAKYSPHTEYR